MVLSFLSVLSPSGSTNYKQFLLWGKACCTLVFGPPAPLVDFAISRFVVWFFLPWVMISGLMVLHNSGPRFGVSRQGSPRFDPICSNCSDLHSLFSGMPDLLRFAPTCLRNIWNKSGQVRIAMSADVSQSWPIFSQFSPSFGRSFADIRRFFCQCF